MRGQEIRLIREALGVSQARLASAIGKSQALIHKVESGKCTLTPEGRAWAAKFLAAQVVRRLLRGR